MNQFSKEAGGFRCKHKGYSPWYHIWGCTRKGYQFRLQMKGWPGFHKSGVYEGATKYVVWFWIKRIGVKDKETYSYYQWYLHAKDKLSRYVQGVTFSCSKRCIRDFAIITSKGGWDTRWGQREKSQPCQERSCLHNRCYWGRLRRVLNFLKGLLNFLVANSSPPHPLPPVAEKVEMTNCFLICKSQSPLSRKILVYEQRQRDHRRVPNNNNIF